MERAQAIKKKRNDQTGQRDVLLWSHEDPGALLPGLPVDKCAIDFGVHAMRAGVESNTTDLRYSA